jgi:hypothetical protein
VQAVAGLTGLLERNPAGGERLRAPGGNLFALVPATTALDARLTALAAQAPLEVRVTGTLYRTEGDGPSAFIVVTAIVAVESASGDRNATLPARTPATPVPSVSLSPSPTEPATPQPTPQSTRMATAAPTLPPTERPTERPTATATPTPTPRPAPMATGRFDAVNLLAGPGDPFARVGRILLGQRCAIVGRNAAATWIEIECPGSGGWIEPRFVFVSGDSTDAPVVQVTPPTPTPPPSPTPPPTATPFAFQGWRTFYFANTTLAGVPLAVDDLASIDMAWGTGAPRPGMPADGFSIRFERVVNFDPGFYFFSAEADDGIRVLLDGVPMLDQFGSAGGQSYRFGVPLAGVHTLRVEYLELTGLARVRFGWQAAPANRWFATYTGLPFVDGAPVQRMEPDSGPLALDYHWGNASPTGAPAINWMARWEGRFTFPPGNYLFFAQADDGVRLWLDGILVLDKWSDGFAEVRNRFVGVGGGEHAIRVEYYQRVGVARIRVWWVREAPAGLLPQ